MREVLEATDANVAEAGAVLRGGGLVVMPTETVYGLGANALDERAVARVFAVKARPSFDPLIVHVKDDAQARSVTAAWPEEAGRLAGAFWPGALTLVLPKAEAVPGLVTAGLGTVAVRVPGHAVALRLIEAAGVPVAAPSANRFGSISPTRAADAVKELDAHLDEGDLVLDGGPCTTGVESTVVSLVEEGRPVLLRPGGVSAEAIEAELGVALARPGVVGDGAQASPGMLERHYAPRTALLVVDVLPEVLPDGAAVLRLPADDVAAAAALFASLRALDEDASVRVIYAVWRAERGLGRAINDRLRRAGHPG